MKKKDKIINAAIMVFSQYGYKKASTDDIIRRAGISKGLLFHYFGNKKALFFYLFHYCTDLMIEAINSQVNKNETDFFSQLKQIGIIKLNLYKQYPSFFEFLKRTVLEPDEEINQDLILHKNKILKDCMDTLFANTDISKFKPGIDLPSVIKILTWTSEGYLSEFAKGSFDDMDDIEKIIEDFEKYLDVFKQCFYREEYLI